MRLVPADKATIEAALFHFLLSVCDGHPQATEPLVVSPNVLRTLYDTPSPDLQEALRHCLDTFLLEVSQNAGVWGTLHIPVEVLGLTLCVHNYLAPTNTSHSSDGGHSGGGEHDFSAALAATLPPANTCHAALAYHAVLRALDGSLSPLEPAKRSLRQALIERSPLTALWGLHIHMPMVLEDIAATHLTGWRQRDISVPQVWRTIESWLDVVVAMIADDRLARWLRHRWLALPETRQSCRNMGLVLEALRYHGGQRTFILDFYEAYDHFHSQSFMASRKELVMAWPILSVIATLLHVSGEGDVALRVNRRGNEYFLKFLPLVQIVCDEGGIPADYAHLSREFVNGLLPLLPYITEGVRQRIQFGAVKFET